MSKFVNCGTVCCVIMSCHDGIILIRRANPESEGFDRLAFPGGYQEGKDAEPVRHSAAREVYEEIGILLDARLLKLINIETDEYRNNVIFFEYPKFQCSIDSIPFRPNTSEVSEIVATKCKLTTVFETHTIELHKALDCKYG